MTPRARRKDANQDAIAAAFEALGCWVIDTSRAGDGFPDQTVVFPNGRLAILDEVKADDVFMFTPAEVRFYMRLVDPVYRVTVTVEQVPEVYRDVMGANCLG